MASTGGAKKSFPTGGRFLPAVSPVGLQEIRRAWNALEKKSAHPGARCHCPACLFAEHRRSLVGRRRPFGPESFFLYWLVRGEGRRLWRPSGRHVYQGAEAIVRAIGLSWSKDRIRLKVWRVRKSRIIPALEKRIKWQPQGKRAAGLDWRLLLALVDFLLSRPGRRATQREVLRHFSTRRLASIEAIFGHGLLRLPAGSMPVLRVGRRYELTRSVEPRGCFVISLRPK